jgi:hypothetical protein
LVTAFWFAVLVSALWFVLAAGICLGVDQPVSAELEQEVKGLVESHDRLYQAKDVQGLMGLFDPKLGEANLAMVKGDFEKRFEDMDSIEVKSAVTGIQPVRDRIAVRLTRALKFFSRKEQKETASDRSYVVFLGRSDGRLWIKGLGEEITQGDFDPGARTYRSEKGRYSLRVPEKWIPLQGGGWLKSITADSLALLGPDLESTVILGFVQLPLKLTPKQAIEADTAMEKRFTSAHTTLEQGDLAVGDLAGYRMISQFDEKSDVSEELKAVATDGKGPRKRMRVYLTHDPMLYFFVCDAIPPDRFGALKPDFDAMVQSFALLPSEDGRSVQEAAAGELARGTVSGQTYTSKEFNCFIAAPEGWEVRTSPNPAHLVEMRYAKGNSLARLIAAKGIPSELGITKKAFEGRLGQVKAIVQDFNETSRRDVTVQGEPAIESVQTFTLEGIGKLRVKEVTVVRNGIYYLVLCQCIEPDQYEALEPHFDKIIQSFGFIQ